MESDKTTNTYACMRFTLQTGIVPDKLKITKVIPLYKNDNPELIKNDRPIPILPCFSNIIERILYNRVYSFLAKHNIISEKQYGFRKKYAIYIYMTLIDLVDKISSDFDKISINCISRSLESSRHNISHNLNK